MVTIGIPFHNSERYLEMAIKSVLKQTFKDWKLILMDDGSKDNSLNIAKKYAALDSRITVFSDGLNKHLASRLNEIAKLATTKYLARMDADDIMHPKRIEVQFNILKKHTQIDVLGTNAYSIDEINKVQGVRMKADFNCPRLLPTKGFIHPTIMAKTEWFLRNPYDVNMIKAQDFELWTRTHRTNSFMLYSEPLLYYREFGTGFYKKYFAGLASILYVARKHRRPSIYVKAVRYWCKAFLFWSFNKVGWDHKLISDRYFPLDKAVHLKATKTLEELIV